MKAEIFQDKGRDSETVRFQSLQTPMSCPSHWASRTRLWKQNSVSRRHQTKTQYSRPGL